jgi:ribosomal protein S18 acetylase RimI-like enzyme
VPPADLAIRRAVPADAPALADLAARTFREAFGPVNRPEDIAAHLDRSYGPRQQLAEIRSDAVRTLLASVGGALAGFAQVRRSTVHAPAELWRLYVDRPWHGRGVADRLMAAALDEARDLGAASIWLGVWEHNPRAIAFYARHGFVPVGTQAFVLGEDRQTDLVLVRPDPGDGVVRRAVVLGARPAPALREALREAGVRTNAYFDVLWPHVAVADPPRALVVEIATAAALGLPEGATLDAAIAHAAPRGLVPCPLEAAAWLALSPPAGEGRITVVSPRAIADEAAPRGFYVRRDEAGTWLRAFVASDDWRFDAAERFALAVRG